MNLYEFVGGPLDGERRRFPSAAPPGVLRIEWPEQWSRQSGEYAYVYELRTVATTAVLGDYVFSERRIRCMHQTKRGRCYADAEADSIHCLDHRAA